MIGVFDSGVGGLSILKKFLENLPEYNYYYLGDNNKAPYGDLNFSDIYNNTLAGVEFLFKSGCELVIIACNTASAKALRKIQQEVLPLYYPEKKVLGIIIPTVEAVAALPPSTSVTMIGTEATFRSRVYNKEFYKAGILNPFYAIPTSRLATFIEPPKVASEELKDYLKKSLSSIKEKKVDVLLLGCTHYFLIEDEIKAFIDKRTRILDIPYIVSVKLRDYLNRHTKLNQKIKKESKLILSSSAKNIKDTEKLFKRYLDIPNYPKLKFIKT